MEFLDKAECLNHEKNKQKLTNEVLRTAASLISNTCNENSHCCTCPFCNKDNGNCIIGYYEPCEWEGILF